MLMTARVPPLPAAEDTTPSLPVYPSRETALAFNRGAIFVVLAPSSQTRSRAQSFPPRPAKPKRHALGVLNAYKMQSLRLVPGSDPSLRWTLTDLAGRWWDGAMQELDIYHGGLLMRPAHPVMTRITPWGMRAVFKFRLLPHYKVLHLAQLNRRYPEIAEDHPELLVWP
jgi:hypothetical protein